MKRRADHQPGYVLHTYPYKETSLIVEAFTRAFGRVALLARGARRPRSAMRGVLLAFHPLRLGWSASAELGNLISAEWAGALQPLAGRGLMCGFYLNELLLRLLPRDDPHEGLFDAYAESLKALSEGAPHAHPSPLPAPFVLRKAATIVAERQQRRRGIEVRIGVLGFDRERPAEALQRLAMTIERGQRKTAVVPGVHQPRHRRERPVVGRNRFNLAAERA